MTTSDQSQNAVEHKLERQTWVSEIEILELSPDGSLEVVRSEGRGPVKNEDAIKCLCGREFATDEEGRDLAAEHLRTAQSGGGES